MKYAITYENNFVFQHFGKCPSFLIVDIEDGVIQSKAMLSSNGSGHHALVDLIKEQGVETLVCGGIGGGAIQALTTNNIQLIRGISGNVDDVIDQLKKQLLQDHPEKTCNHHDHEDHDCSDHKCH